MPATKSETETANLEYVLFQLIRKGVRAEVQEITTRDEDRLLTIDQVAETLAVSKDWIYRHKKRFAFTRKLGPKLVRFSAIGLQKWLKEKGGNPPFHK